MMECMARDSSAAIALASVRMAASRSQSQSHPITFVHSLGLEAH